MDRRDGTRHVRTHDRRQRLDDDHELGSAAPVAALGNVDRHDDGHDAPVRLTLGILYGAIARRSAQGTAGQIYALAAGYVIVWGVFSLGATALQRALAELLLVSPMMEITSSRVSGTLLLMAGVYQLTPMKHACLRTCQSPLGFLMSRWRAGRSGAFGMGLEHGAYCVGCCWALMLLLFAGGVMNLTVIAALTAFVAFEKLAPLGPYGARISGVLVMAAGFWMVVR